MVSIAEYELVRAVGQGGMAQVWLARRPVMGGAAKACALKVPLEHLAQCERFRRMFVAEARVAMGLSHANIVGTFDAGEAGGIPFIAMEWVDGVDLARLAERTRQGELAWSFGVAAHVLGELLHALSYAHGFRVPPRESGQESGGGVVHRDVSPHNVLVSASGEVKLTDFGIARIAHEDTSQEHTKGKLRYMPAEHLRGRASARSDLYAAGAIFHELLAGKKFRDEYSGDGFFGAILDGVVPEAPREDMPAELESLRRGLLEPREDKRIASADEAIARLCTWPGYRNHRLTLRRIYQRCIGSAARRSGLTGYHVMPPQMRRTLESLPSGPPAAPEGARVLPLVPRIDPTCLVSPPSFAQPDPTWSEPTWSAPPVGSGGRQPGPSRARPTAPGDASKEARVRPSETAATATAPTTTAATTTAVTTTAEVRAAPSRRAADGSARRGGWPVFAACAAAAIVLGVLGVSRVAARPIGVAAMQLRPHEPEAIRSWSSRFVPHAPPHRSRHRPDRSASPRLGLHPTQESTESTESTPVEASSPPAAPATHSRGLVPEGTLPAGEGVRDAARSGRSSPRDAAAARARVAVVLDFVDSAELRVAGRRYAVEAARRLRVPEGRHRVQWRLSATEPWRDAGRVHFAAGTTTLIRVRPGGLKTTEL